MLATGLEQHFCSWSQKLSTDRGNSGVCMCLRVCVCRWTGNEGERGYADLKLCAVGLEKKVGKIREMGLHIKSLRSPIHPNRSERHETRGPCRPSSSSSRPRRQKRSDRLLIKALFGTRATASPEMRTQVIKLTKKGRKYTHEHQKLPERDIFVWYTWSYRGKLQLIQKVLEKRM